LYRPDRASLFQRRIVPTLRQLGKFGLFGLAFTYPIYLVYVGLAFGGLVFWSFFAGSFTIIGVVITRLGYASNFRNWDPNFRRVMAGTVLGFLIAVGFYSGLIYLKSWFLPAVLGLLGLGLLVILRRQRS